MATQFEVLNRPISWRPPVTSGAPVGDNIQGSREEAIGEDTLRRPEHLRTDHTGLLVVRAEGDGVEEEKETASAASTNVTLVDVAPMSADTPSSSWTMARLSSSTSQPPPNREQRSAAHESHLGESQQVVLPQEEDANLTARIGQQQAMMPSTLLAGSSSSSWSATRPLARSSFLLDSNHMTNHPPHPARSWVEPGQPARTRKPSPPLSTIDIQTPGSDPTKLPLTGDDEESGLTTMDPEHHGLRTEGDDGSLTVHSTGTTTTGGGLLTDLRPEHMSWQEEAHWMSFRNAVLAVAHSAAIQPPSRRRAFQNWTPGNGLVNTSRRRSSLVPAVSATTPEFSSELPYEAFRYSDPLQTVVIDLDISDQSGTPASLINSMLVEQQEAPTASILLAESMRAEQYRDVHEDNSRADKELAARVQHNLTITQQRKLALHQAEQDALEVVRVLQAGSAARCREP